MSDEATTTPAHERKTKRVLLCGGHLDGQWVDVPDSEHVHRVLKPQPITFADPEAPPTLVLPVDEYRLEPLPIKIRGAGGQFWVGAIGYGPERDEAILRGLLQRDVAHQLLGGVR